MVDPRLQKWADVLVNYSNEVKPGQWAVIQGQVITLPLIREIYRAVLRAGGQPTVLLSGDMSDIYYAEANDAQLEWVSPVSKLVYENVEAFFTIWGTQNTRAMNNVDPQKVAKSQASSRDLFMTFMQRIANKEIQWVGTQYPTHADAQEAEMSLTEYEEFVFGAMLLHCDNPIGEWRKVSAKQQTLVDWLKGKKRLTVKSENCDLSLSFEGRSFINCDGHENFPDGEIFTGPVEDSVNGWVRFTFPAIYGGRSVEGVELKFEGGKVVEASATKNEEFLLSQLDLDAGARYLGEFAIGTNFGIKNYTGNTLFDEKIGGTVHMALGASIPESGGKNESAIHWDMVCDMRGGGEIHIDNDLFYKDGDFVL